MASSREIICEGKWRSSKRFAPRLATGSSGARLNEAVTRVLALKAAAGLFGTAHPRRGEAVRVVGCAAHRAVELEAARAAVAVVRTVMAACPWRSLPAAAWWWSRRWPRPLIGCLVKCGGSART